MFCALPKDNRAALDIEDFVVKRQKHDYIMFTDMPLDNFLSWKKANVFVSLADVSPLVIFNRIKLF